MWPLAECISSLLVRTPSLQLGVLQSLRSSFQTRSIPSSPRWFIPLVESRVEVQSQVRHYPKQPKLGIREWTPLHALLQRLTTGWYIILIIEQYDWSGLILLTLWLIYVPTNQSRSHAYSGLKNLCNVWELWADCNAALYSVEISLSASVMK